MRKEIKFNRSIHMMIPKIKAEIEKIQSQYETAYDISLDDLEEAEQLAAYVVHKYGDRYLPIYVRLREETARKKELLRYKEDAINQVTAGT